MDEITIILKREQYDELLKCIDFATIQALKRFTTEGQARTWWKLAEAVKEAASVQV